MHVQPRMFFSEHAPIKVIQYQQLGREPYGPLGVACFCLHKLELFLPFLFVLFVSRAGVWRLSRLKPLEQICLFRSNWPAVAATLISKTFDDNNKMGDLGCICKPGSGVRTSAIVRGGKL